MPAASGSQLLNSQSEPCATLEPLSTQNPHAKRRTVRPVSSFGFFTSFLSSPPPKPEARAPKASEIPGLRAALLQYPEAKDLQALGGRGFGIWALTFGLWGGSRSFRARATEGGLGYMSCLLKHQHPRLLGSCSITFLQCSAPGMAVAVLLHQPLL